MQTPTVNKIENIYDTYSPMLYGIALEISPSAKQAEEILLRVFKKLHEQYFTISETYPSGRLVEIEHSMCATLIRLTIQTARERLNGQFKNNDVLKAFQNTPLLHRILCQNITINQICEDHKLTAFQAAKQIREELNSTPKLRPIQSKTTELFRQAEK